MACATYRQRHGGFACGRITTTAHIRVDQRRFVAPMDFCALFFCLGLDCGIVLIEPDFDGFGTLFYAFLIGFCGVNPQRER